MDLLDVYAKLSLDTKGYDSGMAGAETTAQTTSTNIAGKLKTIALTTAAVITAVAGATTAVGKALWDVANDVSEAGDEIDKMSQKIGISKKAYQEWAYVFELAGTDVNNLQTGMKTLSSVIVDAGNGSDTAREKLEAVGLTIEELNGLSQEQQLEKVIYALQGMGEGADRTAAATDLLGKSATDMAALLNMTAEATENAKNEANEYGMVMSDDAVTASANFQDSLTKMNNTFSGLKRTIIGDMLPGFTSLMDGISMLVIGSEGAGDAIEQGIDSIVGNLEEIIPRALEVVDNVAPVLMKEAPVIIEALLDGLLRSASILMPASFEMVTQIIRAITLMLPKVLQTGLQIILVMADGLSDALPNLVPVAVDAIMQIVTVLLDNLTPIIDAAIEIILALNEGIIAALPILIDSLPMIISKLVETLLTLTPQLLYVGLIMIEQMSRGMVQAIVTLVSNIPAMFVGIYQGIVGTLWNARDIGINLVKGIWEGMQSMYSWMTKKVASFGNDIMKSIKNVLGIHSPSREFAKIGRFMVEGMGEGWEDEIGDVKGSMIDDMDFSAQSASVSVASQSGQNSNLVSLLEEYLPQIANMQIVMDTGATVGQLVSPINDALGIMTDYSGRMVTV